MSIVNQALSLSASERANIAQLLIQSLETSESYEEEWLDTVEQRRADILSGKVTPIKWNELKDFVYQQ
jgi:putative addiction module component (TIGR02574 family)